MLDARTNANLAGGALYSKQLLAVNHPLTCGAISFAEKHQEIQENQQKQDQARSGGRKKVEVNGSIHLAVILLTTGAPL